MAPHIRHHHTRRHLERSLAVGMIREVLESMTAGDNHQLDVVLHHSLAVPGRRPYYWRGFAGGGGEKLIVKRRKSFETSGYRGASVSRKAAA